MKTENWIVAFGAGILFTAIVVALFPDDLWDDDLDYSSHAIGNTVGVAPFAPAPTQAPGYAPAPAYAPAPVYAPAPAYAPSVAAPPTGQNVAMPAGGGLVPFTAARSEPFAGTVIRTHAAGAEQGWGQVHVWISQRNGGTRELSLGPGWYLEYLGCPILGNSYLEGVGFDFGNTGAAEALLYAKDVTVNGIKCRLRNDEGFALWSNRLR